MRSLEKGNAGESFVNDIAYNSFIKYWCYPNPRDEKGDKKEICDLLIIFNNVLIIISVKNYDFKEKYDRYFKQTVGKAIKQIKGAERKLFSDRDIYIKHPEKQLEKFDKASINKTYRVIVNLGDGVKFYPLAEGLDNGGFVNLFDKNSYKIITKELDTIPDFIEYLDKREALFKNKNVVSLPGDEYDFSQETAKQFFEFSDKNLDLDNKKEMIISGTEYDLLAYFLRNERNFPSAIQDQSMSHYYLQIDGEWEEFINLEKVKEKKENDKISYFIDNLVSEQLLYAPDNSTEMISKALLSFNRFTRRVIAESFFEFYKVNKLNRGFKYARRYGDIDGHGIVFAFYTPEMNNEMVEKLIQLTIESFCVHSKYKSKTMLLIATTTNTEQFKFQLMKNVTPFPSSLEKEIMEDAKSLGWFTNYTETPFSHFEYPK